MQTKGAITGATLQVFLACDARQLVILPNHPSILMLASFTTLAHLAISPLINKNNRGRTTVVFADQENFINIIPARADVGSQG